MITFGSPLDKMAFFMREYVDEKEEYIRFQIINNYLSFKQRDWAAAIEKFSPPLFKLSCTFDPLFDHVKWRNYHDGKDYVSGSLDYYYEMCNVDCDFKTWNPLAFTHSRYWKHKPMYADIIHKML